MDRWLKIMTSRSRQMALSRQDLQVYSEALAILNLVIEVFKAIWAQNGKPVQTHVIMATSAVFELQEFLLNERNYDFILSRCFQHNSVENLFSQVRSLRPNPTALEFKFRLRDVVVSQCHSSLNIHRTTAMGRTTGWT